MRITTVTLSDDLHNRVDQVARDSERSRSFVVRKLLERALTGEDRMTALKAIADAELEAGRSPRERAPNAGELLDTTEGRARVQSLERIAAANMKKRT
jgi:predicted transcriptional regulator